MRLKNPSFWAAALVGLIVDQVTKLLVFSTFELGQTIPLIQDVFHLTFVTNKGAAFSLFSESGEWLRWLSLLVSLGLIALGWFSRLNRWEQFGYGFILAGAAGNGIDRFLRGEVVDFFDFRLIQFPVFNVADICINLGIACLLIVAFRPQNGNGQAKRPPTRD
ncbi:signal peptidase II [Leptolyngbya sp. FACHB-711]|jgi:signal peptidase II|uniref:signal peptidase II n=1 Tax=unclassified Leptolyngbya TaxID=2650499 RepID=UPI0016885165|nr:signal peptidase II [Leptolyngbya sp. FACHB-711]MBD1848623.1 lipoprotein signal peptidase [Cyanobacteria bacterium FACHB-502]MBD2027437.1 lipoprotein signal peptidase [Leptolyngbya sp. FACHB-711]